MKSTVVSHGRPGARDVRLTGGRMVAGALDRRTACVAVGCLTAVAAVIASLGLGHKSYWWDETASVAFAHLDWASLWKLMATSQANMGLYYVLLHPWVTLGSGEVAVRSLSVLFAVLTVPLMYNLGARLFGSVGARSIARQPCDGGYVLGRSVRVALRAPILMVVSPHGPSFCRLSSEANPHPTLRHRGATGTRPSWRRGANAPLGLASRTDGCCAGVRPHRLRKGTREVLPLGPKPGLARCHKVRSTQRAPWRRRHLLLVCRANPVRLLLRTWDTGCAPSYVHTSHLRPARFTDCGRWR